MRSGWSCSVKGLRVGIVFGVWVLGYFRRRIVVRVCGQVFIACHGGLVGSGGGNVFYNRGRGLSGRFLGLEKFFFRN